MKNYKFKENKISIISENIGLIIFISGFVLMPVIIIISLFISKIDSLYGLIYFLISLLVTPPFVIISNIFSKRDQFTKEFIKEIKLDLSKAKTKSDLINVLEKLEDEAIDEDDMVRLSYASDIKELFREIYHKIDILEKQKYGNIEEKDLDI
jgi:hypothetical protein